MIGRRVKSDWYRMAGVVIRWDPLGASMCDILVREDSGRECWYASHSVEPADGLGALPSRVEARRTADAVALTQLRAIRAQHVRDFHVPWPGLEHGKALLGQSIDGAIRELLERGKS